jgi:hypothetical protein
MLGATRIFMTIEEHGAGRQLVRIRCRPKCSARGLVLVLLFASISACAAYGHSHIVSVILGGVALLIAVGMLQECATIDILSAFDKSASAVKNATLSGRQNTPATNDSS